MDKNTQKEKIMELASLIKQTGTLYAECLMDKSLVETNSNKIYELESLGDTIQGELDDHFAQEKNIPYLAIDRANLVRRLDDVLDQMLLAARTLGVFGTGLSDDFQVTIKKLADYSKNITECIEKGVQTIYSSFQDTLNIIKDIEDIRDKSSDITFEIITVSYKKADPSNGWKQFEAMQRIIQATMKIINKTKEASEVLQIMILKYVN